jgi:hypothetical protein
MNIGVEKWLSHLPFAEEHAGDGIVLTGLLVPGDPGGLHVLVGELRLSFLNEDIVEIEPVATSESLFAHEDEGMVRVLVRRGAPVEDVRPSELCNKVLPQRRPFALSVRPLVVTLGPRARFRDLEREFLLSQSLIDA